LQSPVQSQTRLAWALGGPLNRRTVAATRNVLRALISLPSLLPDSQEPRRHHPERTKHANTSCSRRGHNGAFAANANRVPGRQVGAIVSDRVHTSWGSLAFSTVTSTGSQKSRAALTKLSGGIRASEATRPRLRVCARASPQAKSVSFEQNQSREDVAARKHTLPLDGFVAEGARD